MTLILLILAATAVAGALGFQGWKVGYEQGYIRGRTDEEGITDPKDQGF